MTADVRTEIAKVKADIANSANNLDEVIFKLDALIATMTKAQREKFDNLVNPKTPQEEVDSGE